MALSPGSRFGSYEIVALLGAGGMGEVYRARDQRLGRDVAIKIVHAQARTDADRRRRFEQEARAAGQLNHPNILVVHDIGVHDDVPYLVSELLEGETLRARLARARLPPATVLDFALQIARGLQAAHDKGIVHRDLKPENLFVTPDGRIKILDFGLAKLREPVTLPAADTATAQLTEPGLVMGTAGYMSPEQVRGEDVDHRSDLFAFGAIVHEMATGEKAFDGPTGADSFSAILTRDPPDAGDRNPAIAPALGRIIRRCLAKSRAARFQSASDLCFAIDSVSQSGSAAVTGAVAPAPTSNRTLRAWIATGLILGTAAIVALAVWPRYFRSGVASAGVLTAAISPPWGSVFGQFAVSPDGRKIAFTSTGADGPRLWVRALDQLLVKPD